MRKYIYIAVLSLALLPELSAQPLTLSLEECREMALQNDPYVRNARLDVLAARMQKQEALAEYFPTVSINAFGFWSLDPMLEIGVKDILGNNALADNVQNIVDAVAPLYGIPTTYKALEYGCSAGVSVVQPIFAGGRITNGNRLAAIGVESAQYQENIVLRTNSGEVESSYWQVVALEEKMRTLELMKVFVDTLYRDISSAVDAGLAVDTDQMQVTLRRNELRNGMVQLRGGIRLAKMNLFNAIGQDYSMVKAVADSAAPFIDDIRLSDRLDDQREPETYYRDEEEIAAGMDENRLLELSVEAKRLEKKMALGEALPSVGVGASYGYSRLLNGRFNGTVYAMVQIPVSDWGKVSRRVRRQEYQVQKAENEREYLSAQILLQVRQLWLDLTVAWDGMLLAQESMDVAQRTVDSLAESYRAGLVPLSELLQAQTSLRGASDAYLDAQIAYSRALTAYLGRQ